MRKLWRFEVASNVNRRGSSIPLTGVLATFLVAGLLLTLCGCAPEGSTTSGPKLVLNGAGATFPAPVYSVWAYNYSESTGERVLINYQGTGSGAGINQLKEGTIDFAGCDYPQTTEDLREQKLHQFPMLGGGIVLVVNIPGIEGDKLRLTPETLSRIFLGEIVTWNDPALQADNKDLTLPQLPITVVHRSDASGTSFLFTQYLSAVSDQWRETAGAGPAINWPVGIGGQKNPGVCSAVGKTAGAIGYTEYTFALESKLACACLRNSFGTFVKPNPESFASALTAQADSGQETQAAFAIQKNENDWPIVGITWIVMRDSLDETRKKELENYFKWCFDEGQTTAEKLHYIIMPAPNAEVESEGVNDAERKSQTEEQQ
ncbi:MAG: phosphate ABC transporter substrate-binding protein PstS [Planctomycetia bacterium]|nr:phosphate ABC transporter substrate-binding protein PstS [Planctomycetia bacterium]